MNLYTFRLLSWLVVKMIEEEIPEWEKRELENWSGIVYVEILGKINKRAREFFENDIFELGYYEKIEFLGIGFLQYFHRFIKENKLFEMENKKIGVTYSYYVKNTNIEFFIKINEIFKKLNLKGSIIYGHVF